MSNKRKAVEEILAGLSGEEIESLLGALKDSVTSREAKRNRRGRGKRKKKKKESPPENAMPQNPSDAQVGEMILSSSEMQELEEASKFDKDMGFDRPSNRVPKVASASQNRVEARCRVCGSIEMVSPSFLPPEKDRYKCNTCSCSAG